MIARARSSARISPRPETCASGWPSSIGRSRSRASARAPPRAASASGTPSADGTKPGERNRAEAAKLADLRQQYLDALREASGDEQLRQAVAGTSGAGSTPVGQTMVTAAPGTEAFKQDFARWESLHREVTLGLERYEASLSRRTIDKAARERLRSGGADATPPEYASSVERYFRALAAEPR